MIGIEGEELLVERPELIYASGKLAMSEARATRVKRQRDGRGFVDEVKPADVVSIHWSWACDTVAPGDVARLRRATDGCLALANETI